MSTSESCLAAPLSGFGDPEDWVDDHGGPLLRFALARVGDMATAEDLVQETLLAAWRGRSGFDGRSDLRTWMTAILRRRIADHFRRVGRRPTSPPVDSAEAPASHVVHEAETSEFWSVVSGCTSDLPIHLARAFRLRTFAEEDPESICQAEGISRKNLSVRLHRARQLLRRCLERRWYGDS